MLHPGSLGYRYMLKPRPGVPFACKAVVASIVPPVIVVAPDILPEARVSPVRLPRVPLMVLLPVTAMPPPLTVSCPASVKAPLLVTSKKLTGTIVLKVQEVGCTAGTAAWFVNTKVGTTISTGIATGDGIA